MDQVIVTILSHFAIYMHGMVFDDLDKFDNFPTTVKTKAGDSIGLFLPTIKATGIHALALCTRQIYNYLSTSKTFEETEITRRVDKDTLVFYRVQSTCKFTVEKGDTVVHISKNGAVSANGKFYFFRPISSTACVQGWVNLHIDDFVISHGVIESSKDRLDIKDETSIIKCSVKDQGDVYVALVSTGKDAEIITEQHKIIHNCFVNGKLCIFGHVIEDIEVGCSITVNGFCGLIVIKKDKDINAQFLYL